jgi:hypothetical protein
LPSFLRRVSPNEVSPFGFGWSSFFFQKDSGNKYRIKYQKDKYNKEFLSIIFTDQKIKNPAKIRRPTPNHALGSKGQALRVFVTISTPRCTSGSILTKNLDSPIRPPNVKAIFFFFFYFFFSFSFLGVKIIYGRSSSKSFLII